MYIEIKEEVKKMTEYLGYTALLLLVVSLTRDNILHLRIISCISAIFFLAQAIMLESYSLMLTQVLIMSIHITMIYKANKKLQN